MHNTAKRALPLLLSLCLILGGIPLELTAETLLAPPGDSETIESIETVLRKRDVLASTLNIYRLNLFMLGRKFIHPKAKISSYRVRIGDGTMIGDTDLSSDPFIRIAHKVRIGKNVIIGNHTMLGTSYETYNRRGDPVFRYKGNISIGDNVRIGLTAAKPTETDARYLTYIGVKTKIENNVLIGAKCRIGNRVTIGKNTVIYPGVRIGDNTDIGPDCIIKFDIGKNSIIEGGALVDFPVPSYVTAGGNPCYITGESLKWKHKSREFIYDFRTFFELFYLSDLPVKEALEIAERYLEHSDWYTMDIAGELPRKKPSAVPRFSGRINALDIHSSTMSDPYQVTMWKYITINAEKHKKIQWLLGLLKEKSMLADDHYTLKAEAPSGPDDHPKVDIMAGEAEEFASKARAKSNRFNLTGISLTQCMYIVFQGFCNAYKETNEPFELLYSLEKVHDTIRNEDPDKWTVYHFTYLYRSYLRGLDFNYSIMFDDKLIYYNDSNSTAPHCVIKVFSKTSDLLGYLDSTVDTETQPAEVKNNDTSTSSAL